MSETFARYPSLQDRVVLVTGGASGIGASIVEHFAAQGARVAFLDFAEPEGRAVADRTGAAFIPCDLRDVPALRAAVAEVRAKLGPVSVLVNNAARDDRHGWETVEPEYWDERMHTNLRHQFFCAQAVAPMMQEQRQGSIVFFGSVSWMKAQGGMPAYTTAKAAVHGLARGLARDLGPHGVRCNVVVPGWIFTERQEQLWATPQAVQANLDRQCLKAKLYPPDIARMVLWLASDDSRMVTAQTFVVDGGGL
ncbi:SDR family NAD(P)-dependent oxidoreductase [Paracraurococcus ruber]|uniref:3-oxoacyl-ACP reductase n=1 Tax=Paracraurococcus ruber TaxID=77675 RepID=A0ABS1D3L6_9PROT|nr:SDR family oxidoreductase [Paracraurococcus ruber]MBK1660862.1 3-oxoacyl-ACP reductase [Paracraurococcus ruber]TDG28242.1 SDR family oxidoreductase [Paracraurococcus ruber]